MAPRIFHLPARLGDALLETRGEVLGRSAAGLWVSLDDRDSLAMLERHPAMTVLYLSRSEYERAIAGLSAAQVAEVIDRRAARWIALAQGLEWMYRRYREGLGVVALAGRKPPAANEQALDAYFEHGLSVLTKLVGEDRFDSASVVDLLIFVLEGDARILAEQERLAGVPGLSEASVQLLSAGVDARRGDARALGAALDCLGRSEYRELLPYMEVERGVFVTPAERELVAVLHRFHAAFRLWKDGLVTCRTDRQIAEWVERGRSVSVMYWNGREWLQQLEELTPAQIEREYERRFHPGPGEGSRAVEEHLAMLILEQALLRRNLLAMSRKQAPELIPAVEEQVRGETRVLRSILRAAPLWLTHPPDGAESMNLLAGLDTAILEDATFLAGLSQVRGHETLRSRYLAMIEDQRNAMARFAALSDGRPDPGSAR